MIKEEDLEIVYQSESSDGFGVRISVQRPQKVRDALSNLNNVSVKGELTAKEKAWSLFSRAGRDIDDLLRLQAAQLDPELIPRCQALKAHFHKIFVDAGFDVIYMEEIPNEYWGENSPEALRNPWYMVTTKIGHIKVGWRKSVIVLDWTRTTVKESSEKLFSDDVTKHDQMIHAWGYEKLEEYLRTLSSVVRTLGS